MSDDPKIEEEVSPTIEEEVSPTIEGKVSPTIEEEVSPTIKRKVISFKYYLSEMYTNIIIHSIKDHRVVYKTNEELLNVGNVVNYLVDILIMIDVRIKCKNYIDKIKLGESQFILDWTTGIGCSKIKEIFYCFDNKETHLNINENLKTKITEYIKEQINNNKNTPEQTLLLSELLGSINNTVIPDRKTVIKDFFQTFGGGNIKIKKTVKKEILGKERCIYKKSGDRKEYLKYKGGLITVSEYKKLMKSKK
jgi:hypothetical protein